MKKYLLLFCCFGSLLLLTGCENQQNKEYYQAVEELQSVSTFDTEKDFQLELSVVPFTDRELQYQLILDEPNVLMQDIQLLVIHDQETDDIFPSLGILDEKVTLDPEHMTTKGIILTGYLPNPGDMSLFYAEFRVMLSYTTVDQNVITRNYQYIY